MADLPQNDADCAELRTYFQSTFAIPDKDIVTLKEPTSETCRQFYDVYNGHLKKLLENEE